MHALYVYYSARIFYVRTMMVDTEQSQLLMCLA